MKKRLESLDVNQLEEHLRHILMDQINVDDIHKEIDILFSEHSEILLDSMDYIKFIVAVEDEYEIEFDDYFLTHEHVNTNELINDVIHYLKSYSTEE